MTREELYCESTTAITLLPFILFVMFTWLLSETYFVPMITNSITKSHHRRRRIIPKHPFYSYVLKKMLTLIIVWSGIKCWSNGLLRNLNDYTLDFLLMINDCLQSNYKMNESTIQELEIICKWLICCSVVACMWWCYKLVKKRRQENDTRRRHINRIHNYTSRRSQTFIDHAINELGEDGYILTQNMFLPELNLGENNTENENTRNPTRPRRTRSCQTLKTEKILGRRKTS